MPRLPRIVIPGIPLHIIQRGNNRQTCFAVSEDYRFYLGSLQDYSIRFECQVHAYVLMTNHVHLLLSFECAQSPARLMKHLGQRYTQYFNRTYERSGTLWDGRYRSGPVQTEGYLLACQRYIELNPVRAGMVRHPAQYRWSSYRVNAQGEACSLVSHHPVYTSLGAHAHRRCAAYRELFRQQLDDGLVDEIRKAGNGNYVLGNSRFAKEISAMVRRRVTPGTSGRPRKNRV